MDSASAVTTKVQWLSVTKSGEKIVDFSCDKTAFRILTRTDGGVDLVLVGRDNQGGMTHARCDLISIVAAVSECLSAHKFDAVSDVAPSVMIRGEIDAMSEDLSKKTTKLTAIPQNASMLNREKWEREVEYLDRVREHLDIAASSCNQMLSGFGKRVFRKAPWIG